LKVSTCLSINFCEYPPNQIKNKPADNYGVTARSFSWLGSQFSQQLVTSRPQNRRPGRHSNCRFSFTFSITFTIASPTPITGLHQWGAVTLFLAAFRSCSRVAQIKTGQCGLELKLAGEI
jgi:hypothetical protein